MFAYTKLMQAMAAAGIVSATDPYFNLTTLLLNTTATNGAQNNTFLDSSTNNFTITRNGNTTQGTFTPFSQTGWSNRFNGTTDFLSLAASTDWQWPSVSWTVEMWVFNNTNTNYTGRTAPIQIQNGSATTDINDWSFGTDGNGKASFYYWIGSGPESVTGSTTIPLNTWTHVAATYDGTSVIKIYVNGVLDATGTKTGTPVTSTKNLIIGAGNGAYYNGFISNFRRVVGSVVYTGNFTPSTTPLTAITNTQILTCQSNRFIDNSTNAYPLTTGGTPSVQAFSPFAPTAAYDTAVVGGSGYFDGSGDNLSLANNAALFPDTGDFTLEFWIYPTVVSGNQMIWGTNANGLDIYRGSASGKLLVDQSNVGTILTSTANVLANTWTYYAITRSGTTARLFVNGVLDATATNSANLTNANNPSIGASPGGTNPYTGYIAGFRFIKGTAVYTATFTPPTVPPTAITNTQLLTNYTNAGIFDSTAKNVLETVGNAQVSTTQAKWGTTSMSFDGTGDYLISNTATTDLYAFSSGDFTIEFWLYLNTVSGNQIVYDGRPSGTQTTQPTIFVSSAVVSYYTNNSTVITGSTLSTGQWYHIAVARSGTSTKMFVNGTQVGSTYTDSTVYTNTANRPIIGVDSFSLGTNPLNGYIDDLRVTKGFCRYTTTFSVPTAAFPLQ